MIVPPSGASIEQAAAIIRAGGLVAFPTETVYGLGANALSDEAVRKVYNVKERPRTNPLICHIASVEEIARVANVNAAPNLKPLVKKLAHLWPGPLSVVLPKQPGISSIASAGRESIAVRIPDSDIARKLIEAAGVPIAAPSANRFSGISPTTASHVKSALGENVDLILDGGSCSVGLESTVISLLEDTPRLLRPGAVTKEVLEELMGELLTGPPEEGEDDAKLSPGLLARHYSPRTPLHFRAEFDEQHLPERAGLISFGEPSSRERFHRVIVLPDDDLSQAGSELFAALHEMDSANLDLILVERCTEEGIGAAIMDRLNRATADSD